jgi:predicted transposase/invertase (TIGR01784 family)
MQNNRQKYFKDRAVYYSTFPIAKQAERGKTWEYRLEPVYCIGILGFSITENGDYFNTIKLKNDITNEVFYEKLTFVFIELPNFHLSLSELTTSLEKWVYLLKNLPTLDEIPEAFSEDYLREACEIAQYAALTARERDVYEQSLKIARDSYAIYRTIEEEATERGIEQGVGQGIEQGVAQVAIAMLKDNQPIDAIAKYTGLSAAEIKQLAEDS